MSHDARADRRSAGFPGSLRKPREGGAPLESRGAPRNRAGKVAPAGHSRVTGSSRNLDWRSQGPLGMHGWVELGSSCRMLLWRREAAIGLIMSGLLACAVGAAHAQSGPDGQGGGQGGAGSQSLGGTASASAPDRGPAGTPPTSVTPVPLCRRRGVWWLGVRSRVGVEGGCGFGGCPSPASYPAGPSNSGRPLSARLPPIKRRRPRSQSGTPPRSNSEERVLRIAADGATPRRRRRPSGRGRAAPSISPNAVP